MSWEVLEVVLSSSAGVCVTARKIGDIFARCGRNLREMVQNMSQHAILLQLLRVAATLWQRYELVDVAAGEYASQLLGLSRAVCASSARGALSACQCCPVCCFSFFVRCGSGTYHIFFLLTVATNSLR